MDGLPVDRKTPWTQVTRESKVLMLRRPPPRFKSQEGTRRHPYFSKIGFKGIVTVVVILDISYNFQHPPHGIGDRSKRTDTEIKFYKIVEVSTILYGCEN